MTAIACVLFKTDGDADPRSHWHDTGRFSIIRFIPGNPAQVILGQRATKEAVQQLTIQLGLDQPWYVQYARYIGDLLKGDLGTSIRTGAAITQEIKPYLFATLELAFSRC